MADEKSRSAKIAIRQIGIGKIKPYAQNNRKHSDIQIDRVAESIKRYGFNQPIVIDENNEILVGHCRRQAAIRLGLREVPVVVKAGLSDVEKRAYRIIDNKTSDDAALDMGNLEVELDALRKDFDAFEAFGLDEYAFPEPPEDEDNDSESDGEGEGDVWVGVFTIKVMADDLESFEEQLDKMLRKFPRVIKEKGDNGDKKGKKGPRSHPYPRVGQGGRSFEDRDF